MISALKHQATLAFFKGSLLSDPRKILVAPGKNSQSDRQFRFTSLDEILDLKSVIQDYIQEAIEIEKKGLKVDFKQKEALIYLEELIDQFHKNPAFELAFESLSPGRKRGYILHFSQPKHTSTRTSRINKCVPKILAGKGFHDR